MSNTGTQIAPATLEQARRVCLAMPEVTERISHGSPAFFVRDRRTVAMYRLMGDAEDQLWCPAASGDQSWIVAADPEQFFVPKYMGPRGWIGIRMHADTDWNWVAGLLADAYRLVAPKTLARQLLTPDSQDRF